MKKIISEVALTIVSPFATLISAAVFLAYVGLCAGGMGIVLPLAGWADKMIDTPTLLIYSVVFGGLLAFGRYWNHLPFIETFEKLALGRGLYVSLVLMIGGLITAGIITNFF